MAQVGGMDVSKREVARRVEIERVDCNCVEYWPRCYVERVERRVGWLCVEWRVERVVEYRARVACNLCRMVA